MLEKLKSRKLWAAIAGSALTILGSSLGLPEAITTNVNHILMAYIAGQGIVDAATALKAKQ